MKEFLDLARRFRETPIVDDYFPDMRHKFDSELTYLLRTMPKIVCLCGSTRFKREFKANFEETMQGNIVVTVGFFAHDPDERYSLQPSEKQALDELHKRKIDLADEVFVLNVGGYIGESARSEIEYATACKKAVRYLETI